jgi:hypothetical protein
VEEAVVRCGRLVPSDLYEWTHVFECLLRAGRLDVLDMASFLYRPPRAEESRWDVLGRQRLRADFLRLSATPPIEELNQLYEGLLDAYDRGGLVYERCLTRLGYARWLLRRNEVQRAQAINAMTLAVAGRHHMKIMEADAWRIEEVIAQSLRQEVKQRQAAEQHQRLRQETGYHGLERP